MGDMVWVVKMYRVGRCGRIGSLGDLGTVGGLVKVCTGGGIGCAGRVYRVVCMWCVVWVCYMGKVVCGGGLDSLVKIGIMVYVVCGGMYR